MLLRCRPHREHRYEQVCGIGKVRHRCGGGRGGGGWGHKDTRVEVDKLIMKVKAGESLVTCPG